MAEPQINTGTSLNSVIGGISDPTERSILQTIQKSDKDLQQHVEEGIAKKESEPRPTPPVMEKAPDQKDFTTDPMQTFGSSAMFLATFGSLLTRRPMTTALNAGAAVMNAANKKDAAAFSKAFDKWKVDNENAWKMADWDLKQYEIAMGKDEDAIKDYIAAHKNETAGLALQARMHEQDLRAAKENAKKGQEAANTIVQYVDEGMKKYNAEHPDATDMEKAQAKLDLYGDAKTRESGFFTKETAKETEKAKASISDETAQFAADQVLAGDKSALSNYGRGEKATANLALIHEKVQQMAKARGITGADMARINAEFAGFQSEQRIVGSRAGAVTYAAAEVDNLMPLAKKAVSDVNLSGFPDLAHLENYAKSHKGDQRYQFAYDTIQELQTAYTSLLVRNGVRSDAAQGLSEGVINLNMGKRNIAGAFEAIEQAKNAIMAAAPAARETMMKDMVKAAGGKSTDVGKAPKDNEVQWLIDHPTDKNKKSFDDHFGEGAADTILSRVPTDE